MIPMHRIEKNTRIMAHLLTRSVLLVCLILLPLVPVAAQDSTPFPQGVVRVSEQLVFPQEVQFRFALDVPTSELASMTLTISYPGQPEILQQVNPLAVDQGQANVNVAYGWSIPASNPPRLFDEISYLWRIVTTRDRVIEFGRSFEFFDTRAQWETDFDPRSFIDVTYSGALDVPEMRSELIPYYSVLEHYWGPPDTLSFLLYGPELRAGCDRDASGAPITYVIDEAGRREIPCNLQLAEQSFRLSGYDAVVEYTSDRTVVRDVQEALFDVMVGRIWANSDVPEWFHHGLRTFYLPELKTQALVTAQQATRTGRILSISDMQVVPENGGTRAVWDAQSYGLVLYTAQLIGVDEIFEFAAGLTDFGSFAEAYETRVGRSLDTVLLEWQNWLYSPQAKSAYGYTIYAADTPTPTLTLSPTPFPPTPTATATPTATVTGVLTPTPSRTPTATRTPVPPSPTVTPMPVVRFVIGETPSPTPTPVPPLIQVSAPSNDFLILVIGGAMLLLAIVLLLYWIAGKREKSEIEFPDMNDVHDDEEPERDDD